jgi:hypothetical protein
LCGWKRKLLRGTSAPDYIQKAEVPVADEAEFSVVIISSQPEVPMKYVLLVKGLAS